MLRSIVSNYNIEKVELLPDDIMIYVNRDWCNCTLTRLREYEYYGDLIDKLNYLLSIENVGISDNHRNPRYILLSVVDIVTSVLKSIITLFLGLKAITIKITIRIKTGIINNIFFFIITSYIFFKSSWTILYISTDKLLAFSPLDK